MVRWYLWAAISLQGAVQLYLLFSAVFPRWFYPYALEWMEGGMLNHAARIAEGNGIYVEPSVEFIDMPSNLREKYQYFTRADISRLRSAGYDAPITPLAEAVVDYVRNYLLPDARLGDESL